MNKFALALLALTLAVPACASDTPTPVADAKAADTTQAAPPVEALPVETAVEAAAATETPAKAVTATAIVAGKKTTSIKDKAVQTIDAQITASKINKTAPNWLPSADRNCTPEHRTYRSAPSVVRIISSASRTSSPRHARSSGTPSVGIGVTPSASNSR